MTRKEKILARLNELGGQSPKRSLGQNFLVSDQVVDRILRAASSAEFTDLIEVGPGLGALTDDLLPLDHPTVLVELDSSFAKMWREKAEAQAGRVRIVEADALQLDWSTLGLRENSLFVSNLPYQISSSLVIERSIEPAGVSRMVLMFQKEVAQRIAARAKTSEYGLLTVIAQSFWETNTVCDAGPKDFHPPPRVASRVLMFKRRKDVWAEPARSNPQRYLRFVKAAFSHRRKLLARNLVPDFGDRAGANAHELILSAMSEQGLVATARAEELDPIAFNGLYKRLTDTIG